MIVTLERDRRMSVEEIETLMNLAERFILRCRGHSLTILEKEVLRGALDDKRYSDLCDDPDNPLHHYPKDYISRYVAHNLWKVLTQALQAATILREEEKASKRNIREYLQRALRCEERLRLCPLDSSVSGALCLQEGEVLQHWVGRSALIADCTDALLGETRVLGFVGITGVGKTALATRLACDTQLHELFSEVHCLRCTSEISSFEALVCLLLGDSEVKRYESAYLIDALIEQLRSQPYLLVLDRLEVEITLLNCGHTTFRDLNLGEFLLQFLATEMMPSRIILTSQVDLPAIASGRYWLRWQTYELPGLTLDESLHLFARWGITETENYLTRIARAYSGHPLALRAIASEICQSPYRGNVAAYWSDYGSEIEIAEQWYSNRNVPRSPRLDRYSLTLADLLQTRLQETLAQLQQAYPLAVELLSLGATHPQGRDRAFWLSQLNDCSADDALLAFHALQRYYFLETHQNNNRMLYRLHPLMSAVALDRSRSV
jgi:hypothetical protein